MSSENTEKNNLEGNIKSKEDNPIENNITVWGIVVAAKTQILHWGTFKLGNFWRKKSKKI